MISHDETARREEAHVKADMAWSRAYKRSRTNGLGDAVRSIGTSRPTPPEVRRHRQEYHRQQLRTVVVKSRKYTDEHPTWNCRDLDRSRYFPHQSEREINRGQRRCA